MRDSLHWDYAGMKLIAERMTDAIMPNAAAAAPTASLAAGSYNGTQAVALSGPAGATLFYTLDGSTPTTGALKYTGALAIATTTTVKAIAIKPGYKQSPIFSATYNISNALTWDAAKKSANVTLSNGALDAVSVGGAAFNAALGTNGYSAGKRYYEMQVVSFDTGTSNYFAFGLAALQPGGAYTTYPGGWANSVARQGSGTNLVGSGFTAGANPGLAGVAANMVIQIAVDHDAGKVWLGYNGTYYNSQNPAAGTNPWMTFAPGTLLYPAVGLYQNNPTNKVRLLAAGAQIYGPPSGFTAG